VFPISTVVFWHGVKHLQAGNDVRRPRRYDFEMLFGGLAIITGP